MRKVQRVADRYISHWRLIKTPHKHEIITLGRWREYNATNPSLAQSLVLDDTKLIDITEREYEAALIDTSALKTKYQPPAEQGGIWWLVAFQGATETFDTPEKHFQLNDVWEDTVNNKTKWWTDPDNKPETANNANITITRQGTEITKVERI